MSSSPTSYVAVIRCSSSVGCSIALCLDYLCYELLPHLPAPEFKPITYGGMGICFVLPLVAIVAVVAVEATTTMVPTTMLSIA